MQKFLNLVFFISAFNAFAQNNDQPIAQELETLIIKIELINTDLTRGTDCKEHIISHAKNKHGLYRLHRLTRI